MCCAYFHPVIGGMETHVMHLCEELMKRGHIVTVYTTDIYPLRNEAIKKKEEIYKGIKIKRFHPAFPVGNFARFWIPKFEDDFDVIHVHNYRHPYFFYTYFAAKSKGIKFFITCHWPNYPRERLLHKVAIPIIDASLGRFILRNADKVFAVSPFEVEWLKNLGAIRNVELLPDAIPDFYLKERGGEKFREKYGIAGTMILSVGRHHPSKGFKDLIKIAPQFKDATIVIVGPKTQYTSTLEKMINDYGVNSRFILTGEVSENEKLDAYAATDVFVLPSRFEAFGIVILEAMAQGKPVIANNVGGVPYVVPDEICLTKVGDLKGLTNKIKLMLTDPELAKRVAEKGRKKAQNFVSSKIGERYAGFIEALFSKG